MKPVCLILAVTVLPSLAMAGQGALGVFADEQGEDIVIDDHVPGARTVYVVHVNTDGSTGSEFRYIEDPGMTMVRVGGVPALGMIVAFGDLDTGIGIAYGDCRVGTFPVYRIDYQALGSSAACTNLRVTASQLRVPPGTWLYNCIGDQAEQHGDTIAIVNPDRTCYPQPVAPSTWGRVKALYR